MGPAWASECVNDGRWSEGWMMLTGGERMLDDEE